MTTKKSTNKVSKETASGKSVSKATTASKTKKTTKATSSLELLKHIAIGDAYGAGFEFAERHDPAFAQRNNDLAGYKQHPWHELTPGCYTDDTQMSIAVAEVVVSEVPWTPEALTNSFVQCFKRDQRRGYSRGFYDFLCSINSGAEFLQRMKPYSDRSGAAMRAVPVGIFPSVAEVIEKCSVQAKLTHNTTDGTNAAIAAALTAHYFIYKLGPKAELGKFLDKNVPNSRPGSWSNSWQGTVSDKGWACVKAAVTAIETSSTMSELLKTCIAFTGDVDTVAAIALGAASASSEIVNDLPKHLEERLENNKFGLNYLKELDTKLSAKFNAKPRAKVNAKPGTSSTRQR